MADLYNDFPSWGETGEYPDSGFFYTGGDQVNEKHLDALWNGIEEHVGNLNEAISRRVSDFSGNVVVGTGLVASSGSGTREIDLTASDGAYVDGQFTGSINASTVTLSANGGTETRTDSIWINTDGNVGTTDGSTSVADGQLKVAEADVATDDTISDIRNYARDLVSHISSESEPSKTRDGDLWHDNSTDRLKARQSGAYRAVATEQDTLTITGGDGLKNGNSGDIVGGLTLSLDVEPADFAGSGLQDDGADNLELINDSITATAGDGLTGGGSTALGGSFSFDVSVSDFAGSGLQNNGSNDLELVNDSITATAGDGLTGGGSTALGGSFSFDINVSDFAGTHLLDDGNGNLTVADDFVENTGDTMNGTLTLNNSLALDMSGGYRASFPSTTSDPAGATSGDFWYRSDLD